MGIFGIAAYMTLAAAMLLFLVAAVGILLNLRSAAVEFLLRLISILFPLGALLSVLNVILWVLSSGG